MEKGNSKDNWKRQKIKSAGIREQTKIRYIIKGIKGKKKKSWGCV